MLFQEPIENSDNIPRRICNPRPLREIAGESIKTHDNQLDRALARKKINPHYFTDRALQIRFFIFPDSRHSNHVNSILTI